jgi:hypothetical protein
MLLVLSRRALKKQVEEVKKNGCKKKTLDASAQ